MIFDFTSKFVSEAFHVDMSFKMVAKLEYCQFLKTREVYGVIKILTKNESQKCFYG